MMITAVITSNSLSIAGKAKSLMYNGCNGMTKRYSVTHEAARKRSILTLMPS